MMSANPLKFGDEIDWNAEAHRAEAETRREHADGGVRATALDLAAQLKAVGASGRLLDCGCNIARYYPPLREAGYKYVGVDQAPEALRIARERYPDIALVQSFLWDMSFAELFDVAISMAVLQHNLHEEKRRILARIAAAVRPGGWFAMQESTVLQETRTQLPPEQWIALVESFGFGLAATWHPNPEYGLHDAYLFERKA